MSFAFVLSSCSKGDDTVQPDSVEAKTVTNISYGSDNRQKLDLYLPADRSREKTRLVIMIHGGGWTSGDKSELAPYVSELQKRIPGLAIANLNYRLATQTANQFPAQENDVKAAVQFLLSKSEEYLISENIVLLGVSAGAHLALLQGYKHGDIIQPEAVISFFAPTDMSDMYLNPVNGSLPLLLQALMGYSYNQNPAIYNNSSPINFVDANSPPTLILHGEKDNTVPIRQAKMLKDKLEAARVDHEYVTYPNEGHGWSGENLEDSFEKVTAFLLRHSK